MQMTRVDLIRLTVFGSWCITFLVVLGTVLFKMYWAELNFNEIWDSLSRLAALITPQLAIMLGFFLQLTPEREKILIDTQPAASTLVIFSSVIYHIIFIGILFLGIILEAFDTTIDGNVDAILRLMTLISVFGLPPVAYLFSSTDRGPNMLQGAK